MRLTLCEGHTYNNVCRGHRVDVVQISNLGLSTVLFASKSKAESAVLCLKWGEFVMCAADPPLLSGESSGVTQGKARWPKCPNVNTDVIREGFLFPMGASC